MDAFVGTADSLVAPVLWVMGLFSLGIILFVRINAKPQLTYDEQQRLAIMRDQAMQNERQNDDKA